MSFRLRLNQLSTLLTTPSLTRLVRCQDNTAYERETVDNFLYVWEAQIRSELHLQQELLAEDKYKIILVFKRYVPVKEDLTSYQHF
jgi:hypothetical protein